MLDDFIFISEDKYNCLENVIASLMSSLGREYLLMFADSCGFAFLPKERVPGEYDGFRVGGGDYNIWESLEKYHGVVSRHFAAEDVKTQWEILKEELDHNRPVVIRLDAFYAPWKDVYKKYHLEHFCLGVGFDDSGKNILCLDPFVNRQKNLLVFDNFTRGKPECITLRINEDAAGKANPRGILRNMALNLLREDGAVNGIAAMKAFASFIRTQLNYVHELKSFEDMIWIAPVIMRITDVGSRRLNFADLAGYLGRRTGVSDFFHFSELIEKSGWGWRRLKRIFISASSVPESGSIREDMASQVERMAEFEMDMCHRILAWE